MDGQLVKTNGAYVDAVTRVSVLETQFVNLSDDVTALQKNTANLEQKITDMRNDFHQNIDEKHEKLVNKLDQQAKETRTQYDALSKENREQHDILSKKMPALEKWRWMLIGAAVVAGYFLGHIRLDKLF
jgi:predicted RNase H-like nuclease (RuvC/YqgF family)